MLLRHWIRKTLAAVGFIFVALAAWFIVRGAVLSLAPPPHDHRDRIETVTNQLNFLEHALKNRHAAEDMQRVFPEGACFMLTLYGLAWANLAQQEKDPAFENATRSRAVAELRWVVDQQTKPSVTAVFSDTQVRRGIFWMGQHNLALGRYLELLNEQERPAALVQEFHENSRALAEAFLASPTHHIETYPGMCWPADNVTALASLLVHDRLYGTDYREAYRAWRDWTHAHPDPPTGLPAGKIDRETGHLDEPARGCANSWMIGVLGAEDPQYAAELYKKYDRHFAVRRLGFGMLREYPAGHERPADVDSGPIVWGAGVAASGIGLGAARAAGDHYLATNIYNLAAVFGYPRESKINGRNVKNYLFGAFPMGDAFIAWGLSVPEPASPLRLPPSLWNKLKTRWTYYLAAAMLLGLLALRAYLAFRRTGNKKVKIFKEDENKADVVETRIT